MMPSRKPYVTGICFPLSRFLYIINSRLLITRPEHASGPEQAYIWKIELLIKIDQVVKIEMKSQPQFANSRLARPVDI